MIKTIQDTYQSLLVRWTNVVCRWAWAVCLIALISCGSSIYYLANNIEIDTSTSDMLSAELSFRKNTDIMDQAFPQMSDTILVVVDGSTPDLADRAALALSQRMRAEPRLFGEVYDPAGEEFFRRNGLLYLDIDELYELSDRLAEAQPFLGALWQDLSIRGLFSMLGKAIDHSSGKDSRQPIEIARLLDEIATVVEAQLEGRFAELSWRQLMQGTDNSANANRRFLLIQPSLDYDSLSPASDAMDAIRDMAKEMSFVPEHGVRVRLTGSAALSEEELESVEKGMGLAGVLSLSLVLMLLMVGLKRVSLVTSTLLTLIIGLIWTATFAIVALGSLNLISVAFAVLFIGLSVDFGIHYSLRYAEAVDGGADHLDGLLAAVRGSGGALTLSALAAAIAFYSFQPTDYRGLAELGLIAGTGMFIALFANLSLLPAFLTCLYRKRIHLPVSSRAGVHSLNGAVERRAKLICWFFLVIGAASLLFARDVNFDFDPLNLKDKNSESMSTLIDLMDDSRTSPYSIEVLVADLQSAQNLAGKLADLDGVASAETLADYVPTEQDEKLDIISSTALFLAPALTGEGRIAETSGQQRRIAIEGLVEKLQTVRDQGPKPDQNAAKRLTEALSRLDLSRGEITNELEGRLLRALPDQLAVLKRSLTAEHVLLEDLPLSVRSRQIAKDGRARIEVFPEENLSDQTALVKFVEDVRSLAPNAIGAPVVIYEAGQAVLRSFYQAGALSVLLIMVLLAVVLRSIRDVLLVFAPLILAGLYSLALSVLIGLSFNFANVIVLPLLFGLGVAGGIHLVTRERDEGENGNVLATSTPRAITFSALTTIGSFGTIALSGHPGTSSMGVLLTLTVSMTLLCTLIFLPALMNVVNKSES